MLYFKNKETKTNKQTTKNKPKQASKQKKNPQAPQKTKPKIPKTHYAVKAR